jgi:hypothetical protein
MSATWFLNKNLTSEIVLPLQLYEGTVDALFENLDGYEHGFRFAHILKRQGFERPKILDLNLIFSSLVGFFHIQSLLDAEANRTGPFYIKAELINAWRTCPFLDVEAVITEQEEHGVPMSMRSRFFAPTGTAPEASLRSLN